jgi:protein-tyrosine-phosphatase
MVFAADAIALMDHSNWKELELRFPEARSKSFLLGCVTEGRVEIADPYTFSDAEAAKVLSQIKQSIVELSRIFSAVGNRANLAAGTDEP